MSQNYLLFEEAGQFKTGTILQDTGTSLQVELTTGKRVKVKQANDGGTRILHLSRRDTDEFGTGEGES